MAGWLEQTKVEEVSAESTPKVRVVGQGDREALERELNHMILSAQTAQDNRLLQACAWHSYLTPASIVQEAIATNKQHAEKTRGQTGHKFGPPHVQSYRVLLKALTAEGEKAGAPSQELGAIKGHLSQYEKDGVDAGWKSIDQFRVRLTKEGQGGLNYSLSQMMEPATRYELENSISNVRLKVGSVVKPGGPPRGDAERKHQQGIEALKAQRGIKKK